MSPAVFPGHKTSQAFSPLPLKYFSLLKLIDISLQDCLSLTVSSQNGSFWKSANNIELFWPVAISYLGAAEVVEEFKIKNLDR